MNYSFTDQFISDQDNARFLRATMMGPNAMRISEEMALFLAISRSSRILDLGCGMGLSTLLLARKYGASGFLRLKTMSVLRIRGLTIRQYPFLPTLIKACHLRTNTSISCSLSTPTIILAAMKKCCLLSLNM